MKVVFLSWPLLSKYKNSNQWCFAKDDSVMNVRFDLSMRRCYPWEFCNSNYNGFKSFCISKKSNTDFEVFLCFVIEFGWEAVLFCVFAEQKNFFL